MVEAQVFYQRDFVVRRSDSCGSSRTLDEVRGRLAAVHWTREIFSAATGVGREAACTVHGPPFQIQPHEVMSMWLGREVEEREKLMKFGIRT